LRRVSNDLLLIEWTTLGSARMCCALKHRKNWVRAERPKEVERGRRAGHRCKPEAHGPGAGKDPPANSK
jgi:hypothetical protein